MMSNYEHILKDSQGVDLIPIDLKLLRVAAQVRAMAQVKTPDALQIASGLVQGCSAFLTNDKGMPTLSSIRILKLYDYLDPAPGC
jgi:predicted nucleic acid-binding protein